MTASVNAAQLILNGNLLNPGSQGSGDQWGWCYALFSVMAQNWSTGQAWQSNSMTAGQELIYRLGQQIPGYSQTKISVKVAQLLTGAGLL